jgi:GAF domain-containing protein
MESTTPAFGPGSQCAPLPALAELALITVDSHQPERSLRRVAELAKQTLGGVEDVSLTMIEDGRPQTVVFTGRLAVDLDERQYELGFGPCVDAARTGQTIVVDHTSDDTPYREWARIARRAGVRQTVSVGLPLTERSIAGLNIYKTAEGPFPATFLEHAQIFARYAATTIINVTSYAKAADEAAGLRLAMQSRAVIEQAKGILIARNCCTPEEAFEMLVRLSQHRNIKLRDLARIIVDSAQNPKHARISGRN